MDIKKEDIVGVYRLKDGNKYIFLIDKTVYKQDSEGKLTKVELTHENIEKMQEEIGTGETDVIR